MSSLHDWEKALVIRRNLRLRGRGQQKRSGGGGMVGSVRLWTKRLVGAKRPEGTIVEVGEEVDFAASASVVSVSKRRSLSIRTRRRLRC